MRLVFFLLVLANLAFFVWSQGYFGLTDPGREPQRLAQQIAPEKLRVIAASDKVVRASACRLVTGLLPDAADALKAAMADPAVTVDIRKAEDATRYWVHIPPQPNKAAADKKGAELKQLGVSEFTIMLDEGPNRYALSLGLFKSQAGAEEFLAGLGKRGVRSARIEKREKPPQAAKVLVAGPPELIAQRLTEVLAKYPDAKAADCP